MAIEAISPPDQADEKPKTEAPRAKAKRAPGSAKLQSQVAELYATIGMVAVTPIDRLAGTLLVKNADDIAEQWVALAETNPTVKRTLQKLVEAGGWGGVIIAHGMIVLPVLANRGMFPDQVANGVAMTTALQHPETADLFTHPRFMQHPHGHEEQGPHVPKGSNGDGSGS